jgi:signal transduction histidine kinase
MGNQNLEMEKKIGELGYVNKNCWLARNLNYPPSKRCQYCELKFKNCLFERYLVITLVLVSLLLFASYLVEQNIPKLLIISIFILVITYGYFFNTSTEKIIVSNFEEKKAKNAFKELSENLQQKVYEQTKDIKKAYEVEKQAHEDLKKLDNAKTQFMLVTQHHLRTPLTITMGYLDLLLGGTYGEIPKKSIEILKKVGISTGKEIKVVNDLLNMTSFQLGRGGIKLEPNVSIKDILKEIVNDLKPEVDVKNIYLKFSDSNNVPQVSADKSQLKMALTNIVDNAIKYTIKGGVDVTIKNKEGKLIVAVKDTGVGISKKYQKDLFDKTFQRSEEAWKINTVGKGIGLYLSAQIIKAHNGKILVESEGKDKGSIFYIELPI